VNAIQALQAYNNCYSTGNKQRSHFACCVACKIHFATSQ